MVPREAAGAVAGGGFRRPYSRRVADFPFPIPAALRSEISDYADPEGKIPRALDRLAEVAGRDVVLLDADQGLRARQLAAVGARVRSLRGGLTEAADASADVVVSFWSAFRPSGGGPSDVAALELSEADRVLRPGGRLLVVHDYARDDVSRLMPHERSAALVEWSRRDGWFAAHGFRIHVIHALWTFPDMARLTSTVEMLFGSEAPRLVGDLHRPRLTWKVVVYDRIRGGAAAA